MRTPFKVLALSLTLAPAAVQSAAAQPADPDPRWQAFLGCWAPIAQEGAETTAPDHVLCFSEHESGAVAATTIAGGEVQSEELIRADGTQHAVDAEACSGTQSARWSEDGARVYLRSALECGDNVLGRESAGVLALSGGGTFIDVNAVGVEDQYGVRVLQYRSLAPSEYPASMRSLAAHADDATRLYAAAPLTLDDIIEASSVLPAPAVQAMLIELPASTNRLDANALIALADAGVAEEVIDVIVALAHPEKFALAAAPLSADEQATARPGRTVWMHDPYRDAWGYGGYGYNRYSRYGYYPYSRFGYNNYGWGYGGGPGTIIIIDRDDNVDVTPDRRGVVVKGRGYTRGGSDSRATEPRSTSRTQSGASSSRGTTTTTSSPSRGSSSGSTRKAQPKNPPPSF